MGKCWKMIYLGKLSYFTNLNRSAIWGWFPLLTMVPGFGRSEVVIIYPDIYIYNIDTIHIDHIVSPWALHISLSNPNWRDWSKGFSALRAHLHGTFKAHDQHHFDHPVPQKTTHFGNGKHTTYLWWNWGWFIIVLPTLHVNHEDQHGGVGWFKDVQSPKASKGQILGL